MPIVINKKYDSLATPDRMAQPAHYQNRFPTVVPGPGRRTKLINYSSYMVLVVHLAKVASTSTNLYSAMRTRASQYNSTLKHT